MLRLSLGLLPLLIWLAVGHPVHAAQLSWLTPTAAERSARPDLDKLQANIDFLEARLKTQAPRAPAMAIELARLEASRGALEDELAGLRARLKVMLPRLWETQVRLTGMMSADVAPWDESDRGLTWMAAIFDKTREDLGRLDLKTGQLEAALNREKGLRAEMESAASQAEKTRDALLAERLKMVRELSALRRERVSPAQGLERILEAAQMSDFSPLNVRERPLEAAQGRMERPVSGPVAAAFAPQASPPVLGEWLFSAPGEPVLAPHWGRVAFAGEVKGLGQVCVLAHGGGALSVFAHLGAVSVRPGQEVARGERLGQAGELPGSGRPGMSFELRFGLKPSNPSRWFRAG